jgi:hypothetical protein
MRPNTRGRPERKLRGNRSKQHKSIADRDSRTRDAFYIKQDVAMMQIQPQMAQWMTDKKISRDVYTFIGPAAGVGALTRGFKNANVLLFDLVASHKHGVKYANYKQLDVGVYGDDVCIFENPPFGQHHAVKFFNTFAKQPQVKYMALVFPDRYPYDQREARPGGVVLNENFHCVGTKLLAFGSFEKAGGSSAQIQCSFQLWERRASKRGPSEHTRNFDVGPHVLSENRGNLFYLKGFDPNRYTKGEHLVTTCKAKSAYRQFPIRLYTPDSVSMTNQKRFITRAIKTMWRDYPHHARPSLHSGNILKALGLEFNKNKW